MSRKRVFLPLCLGVLAVVAFALSGYGQQGTGKTAMSREEALARLDVVNSLRVMSLAILFYSGEKPDSRLPPADGSADPKEPKLAGLSWRAYTLRFMDTDYNPIREGQVYRNLLDGKYPPLAGTKPSESWNRPDLKTIPLAPFTLRIKGKTKDPWDTFFRVFSGPGTAFEPKKRLSFKNDFPDGTSNTILIVEAGEAVPWPKPEELEYDPSKPLPKLGGLFPDGFYAAFADGAVRFIRKDTDEKLIRAMITRNGGEKIKSLPPPVDDKVLRKAAGLK